MKIDRLPNWSPVTALLQHALGQMLNLEIDSEPFSQLEEYFRELEKVPLLQAWQNDSFLELFSPTGDWNHERVFEALNRQHGGATPPVRLDLLKISLALHLPPLPIPLVPIARDPLSGAMTVASWIPGLGPILNSLSANILRDFWCTDFIQCIWASPASIRGLLAASVERLSLDAIPPHEDFRALDARPPDCPWLDAADVLIPVNTVRELGLSCHLMRSVSAVPLYRAENILTVLSAKRLTPHVVGRIQQTLRTTATIFQIRGDEATIEHLIERTETDNIDPSRIFRGSTKVAQQSGTDLETEAVRVVNTCLLKAVKMRSSDIIFAEMPDVLRVRYKVDGGWIDEPGGLPLVVAKEVINHIKMRCHLDISITKIDQDGLLIKDFDGKRYTFRVNTSQDIGGQKAVLRVQPKFDTIRSLEEYGMPQAYIDAIDQTLAGSSVLIVLCGPTGCGKTTTIYSILRRLNPSLMNILAIEDPVEIVVPLISQRNIDRAAGETFASWTRGLLRKAPCVAVVGEMRDQETVEAVITVATSGHRIISTLHTTSA
jgi:hypothetical protein